MSGRDAYHEAAAREVALWPGATLRFEHPRGRGHPRVVLGFNGRERFVCFPSTPSDAMRGALNFTTDLRKALRALGAVRSERAAAAATIRQRRERTQPARPAAPLIADPRTGGFEALRDWTPAEAVEVPREPTRRGTLRHWWASIWPRRERSA